MTRARLPNRRPALTREIEFGGQRFKVTAGFHKTTIDGQPGYLVREVFVKGGGRQGQDLANIVEDVAVLISLRLQYGVPVEALARSMGRVPLGPVTPAALDRPGPTAPASIVGAVLDLLLEMQAEVAAGE